MLAATYPGFHNLKLETVPLAEQAAWFGLTDILVAQHGAGLSNIIWMRHGTHVIEIDPDTGSNTLFSHLAPLFGVSYSRLRQDAGAFGPVPVQDLAALIAPLADSVAKLRTIVTP
jgi:capsular polysaccharide biosynthesis protein